CAVTNACSHTVARRTSWQAPSLRAHARYALSETDTLGWMTSSRKKPVRRKPNTPPRWRPATNYQLWRLNKLGRLQVVDVAQTISAAEAERLIKDELAKTGEPYFADTKLAARLREAKSVEDKTPGSRAGARRRRPALTGRLQPPGCSGWPP